MKALTVLGLGTLSAVVARLVAVAASDAGHVTRLVALLGHMALLTTVAARATTTLGTILGEVTDYKG